MDLIQQLNETTLQREAEESVFEDNSTYVAKLADVSVVELSESITHWIMDIANQLKQGTLTQPTADNTAAMADHVDKMRGTAEIMGAIEALTTPELAQASNIKNPGALLGIAKSNHAQADMAMDKLREIGRVDARGQTQKHAELLKGGDANAIMDVLKKMKLATQKLIPSEEQPQQQQKPGRLGLAGEVNKQPRI